MNVQFLLDRKYGMDVNYVDLCICICHKATHNAHPAADLTIIFSVYVRINAVEVDNIMHHTCTVTTLRSAFERALNTQQLFVGWEAETGCTQIVTDKIV